MRHISKKFDVDDTGGPRTIADRLVFLRRESKLSADYIAKRFGVHRSTYHRWETYDFWEGINGSPEKRLLLLQLADFHDRDVMWVKTGKLVRDYTVAVVDDSHTSRAIGTIYIRHLLNTSSDVHDFADTNAALNWAKNNDCDLFIIDYQFPGGPNGDRLIGELRHLEHHLLTPIVVVTLYDDPEITVSCYEAGANDVLYKPIHYKDFFHACMKFLKHDHISSAANFVSD